MCGKRIDMPEKSGTLVFYTLRSVLFVLLSFILAGCATSDDMGRVQWQINELKSEVKDVKQKSQSISGLDDKLSKRFQALEDGQKATSSAVSDLLIKVQSLTSEVQVLTGRFEEARYFSEKSSKELADARDQLAVRVKELEGAVKSLEEKLNKAYKAETPVSQYKPETMTETAQTKESVETKEGKPAELEVEDIYMEAYKAYKANQFEEAREKFQAILKNYPDNEYSDNARFWIGESHYKEKKYEDAILAYEELFKKNQNSDKIPGAMLKQGLAFYELNELEIGKITLQKLIEKFPDSKEAEIAKKKIGATAKKK